MIKEATIEYEDDINNLGKLVNSNYKKLFPLERIIADKYEKMYIYLDKDVLSGFIHFIEIDETIEIVNIVVDKMKRKQGIGSKLLEYTMKKSSDNIKNIVLEVNTSNQEAIRFYENFNFEIINIRKKYYNGQDGYLMGRRIKRWKMSIY